MLATIYWIEGVRLGLTPRPRGGDWLEDEIAAWRVAGVDSVVSLLETHEVCELGLDEEETLCRNAGLRYFSFPVVDRSVPPSRAATWRLAQELVALLDAGQSVVMHCRQSLGRAPLLAACVLRVKGLQTDEAFARIARARGCEVPETLEQKVWLDSYSQEGEDS